MDGITGRSVRTVATKANLHRNVAQSDSSDQSRNSLVRKQNPDQGQDQERR